MLASTWESYESVINFVRSERYAQFFREIQRLAEEPPKTTHCFLSDAKTDLEVLFTAKAIEMAPLTLFGDKVHQHYINFQTAGKMIAAAPGYVAQFQEPQIEAP